MKELSIEEKAIAYDNVREKIAIRFGSNVADEIFSQFEMSEDERIRKDIVTYLQQSANSATLRVNAQKFNKWIAWLEKQGEQKYTQRDIDDAYLKGIADVKREVKKIDEQTEKIKKEIAEFIFNSKEYIKQRYEWIKCLGFDVKFSNEEKQGNQKPADKIKPKFKVGQTIKKEGFNLGFTIVKIDDDFYYNNMGDYFPFTDQDNWELVEQKSAETVKWSLQEESCICQLESLVKEQWRQADKVHNSVNIKKMSELMFFLKTLNPNKKPQRIVSAKAKEAMYDKPAWSEEDEKMIESCIFCFEKDIESAKSKFCESDILPDIIDGYKKKINWLKDLKSRVLPQPKQEWSEEDEGMLYGVIETEQYMLDVVNGIKKFDVGNGDIRKACAEELNWLKSLRPLKQWKPSDEQMNALDDVISSRDIKYDILSELWKDLKKLKE